MRYALLFTLAAVGCGVSAAEMNAEGERWFAEWEKTDAQTTDADNSYTHAVRCFVEATRLEPSNPLYHYNLGTALASAGLFSDAVAEFEIALRLSPNYQAAKDNLELVRAEWAADKQKGKP